MWNNPDALNRITWLILSATLLFAAWVLGRAALENAFPFQQITVNGANHTATQSAARTLSGKLAGGFFSMDLKTVHSQFKHLPWVRDAQLRRIWPGRLVVELTEHQPAAAWNDRAVLNTHGEIFPVAPWTGLPRLYAPEGMEHEVARRYGEFAGLVKPIHLHVEQIVVSARLSWRVRLAGQPDATGAGQKPGQRADQKSGQNAINVELGRDRLNDRLARFTRFYPQAIAAVGPLHRVDMRYPNGFAGEPAGAHPANQKAANKQVTKKTKPV